MSTATVSLTRTDIAAEIARLEAATPSRIESFNRSRAERLSALREQLASMPVDVEPFDRKVEAQIARFDASTPANRRRDRWS